MLTLPEGIAVQRINLLAANAYLIQSDSGVILVDAGLPGQEMRILRALDRQGWRSALQLIYITHAHVDHYGSAAALRAATGAPIAVHGADAAIMADGRSPLGQIRDLSWMSQLALPWIERRLAFLPKTRADLRLQDGDRLDGFGLDAYVLHTPGHTPGSSALIVADRYAFVGDLVSATGRPHAQSSYAFDWGQVAQSLRLLQGLAPALTFPGHGARPVPTGNLEMLTVRFAGAAPRR